MSFERIPAELRAFPQWVAWRYVDRGGPKPSKLPFSPRTGQVASVTDATTWATFNEAVAALQSGGFDGIGFVFTDADPFTGIDLDDCHGDAEAKAVQDRIFDAFPSYAELSPSGTGLHIIVKGRVRGSRRGFVEVYSTERFFTMTGNVYRDAPIVEGGAALDTLMAQIARDKPSSFDASPLYHAATETDEAVFSRATAATNGDKFTRLWNGNGSDLVGDTSGSAVDQALVNMLAFWTKDPAQIERMWLASPQGQRDKPQQRADYRRSTIERAFDRTVATMDFSHLFKAPSPDELPVVMASALHGKPITPRQWHVAEIIPARTVTLFGGDGGTGKSLAALQLAVGTVLGRAWFGVAIQQPGGALFLTAEDDLDEVHRRLADIANAEHVPLSAFDRLAVSSLAGLDALMAAPGPGGRVLVPTGVYAAVRAYVEAQRPALIVLDTLADLFGGDEVNRAQVRQFVAMLRAIAIDFGTTVVLLAHPSVNGMSNGSGLSGSTAWNNSVRSRLYMKRDDQSDLRTIEVMKANYGAVGQQIRVKWERGVFVLLGNVASASGHRQAANHSIDELFLELLADFEAKGTLLSPQHQSPTRYAPRLMAKHPKANGTTEGGFKLAMVRLLAESRIEEAVERIHRRETLILRAVRQ